MTNRHKSKRHEFFSHSINHELCPAPVAIASSMSINDISELARYLYCGVLSHVLLTCSSRALP